jgi:hypothetical protein
MEKITNIEGRSLVIGGEFTHYRGSQTIKTDAGRAVPLVSNTVVGFLPAENKWVPVDITQTTSPSVLLVGIYTGRELTAAEIVAGDVTGLNILVGGDALLASDLIVVDKDAATIDDAYGTGVAATTIRERLRSYGLYAQVTDVIVGQ